MRSLNYKSYNFIHRTFFPLLRAGLIPSPMLYGMLFDSACILWEQSACDEPGAPTTGSCLAYDTTRFRRFNYGVPLGFELLAQARVVYIELGISAILFHI